LGPAAHLLPPAPVPPEIILHAIWPSLWFTLSYRDVEELLVERDLDISYKSVRRWMVRFGRYTLAVCADCDRSRVTNDTLTGWSSPFRAAA
jgi:transposase-like protein